MTADAPPEPIAGRATLTREDGALLVRASRARIGFFNQARLLLYCAVAAALAAVVALDGHRKSATALLLIAAAVFVAALIAGSRTQRRLREHFANGAEREIALGDDGVSVTEQGMHIAYAWSRFDRALEAHDHFVLLAGASVVVLPKRAFAANDVARVRALVAQRLRVDPFA